MADPLVMRVDATRTAWSLASDVAGAERVRSQAVSAACLHAGGGLVDLGLESAVIRLWKSWNGDKADVIGGDVELDGAAGLCRAGLDALDERRRRSS